LGGSAAAAGYGSVRFYLLHRKLKRTSAGEEAKFTEAEAKVIERVIKWIGKRNDPGEEA
jgi:hypothetical protein